MLIDWEKPQSLPSPRRKVRLDLLNRDRLWHAKARRKKHKAGKAHSTNHERSIEEKAKALELKLKLEKKAISRKTYLAAVRAYWNGTANNHPGVPI